MLSSEINVAFDYFKECAKGVRSGNIVTKAFGFANILITKYKLPNSQANLLINLIIQSGYADYKDNMWLTLTEKGYAFVIGDIPLSLTPDLKILCTGGKNRDTDFYTLWELIGDGPNDNPLYISGPEYYKSIKPFIRDIPFGYQEYMDQLRDKGKSTTRSIWCKELFCMLSDDDFPNFLDSLSHLLLLRSQHSFQPADSILDNLLENNEIQSSMLSVKQPKIFISHNTKDKEYARALVTLLTRIGVKDEDIFCSSIPGYGVPFGKNILDSIKGEYDGFDLIVLFIHSPRFYESPVSLCEMGACWINRKEHYSFLTHDCKFEDLNGVVKADNMSFKTGNKDTYHLLHEFKDRMVKVFGLTPKRDAIWDGIKDEFLNTTENLKY